MIGPQLRILGHETLIPDFVPLGPAVALRAAKLAEALGYRSFWTAEATGPEAFATLAAVGAAAPSLDLGPGVLALQLRTPPLTAMAAATRLLESGTRVSQEQLNALMRVAGEGRVIGAVCASDEAGLVVANGKGRGKRLRVGALAEGTPGAAGQKVLARDMRGVAFAERGAAAWAITSRRIARLGLDGLWSGEGNGSDLRALLRLAKGETLAGLASLPPDDEPIEPVARLDRARA